MSDFCSGCGTEHHWLDCPEVVQSVFDGEDPETAREELEELLSDLADPAYRELLDPTLRRMMQQRLSELVTAVAALEIALDYETFDAAARWLHEGPWDPCGTPVAPDRTGAVS
jgi:ElaB/YqjD/DUF883 family membrane-anchored ribosome-binding protein